MMATAAMLEVRDLSVFYGDAQALDRVSLAVGAGEIVALVGANGAGKTSLIRTVAGILKPREGTIEFDGQPIGGLDSHRVCDLGVGQVAEGRQVFPSMTVLDNLQVGGLLDPPEDRGLHEQRAVRIIRHQDGHRLVRPLVGSRPHPGEFGERRLDVRRQRGGGRGLARARLAPGVGRPVAVAGSHLVAALYLDLDLVKLPVLPEGRRRVPDQV